MPPEPKLVWRHEIGGTAKLPAAWLLDVGSSAGDPAARLALITSLVRAATGRDQLVVARAPSGVPLTSDGSLRLSIASRDGCVAVALAHGSVGIDVERLVPLDPLPLAILHPDERAFVGDGDLARFYALWTAKEAYWKLVGLGFGHGDESVAVIPDGDQVQIRQSGSVSSSLRRDATILQCSRGRFLATCLLK